MKFENALKKFKKIGKVEKQGSFYKVKKDENTILCFIDNGGTKESAICFHADYYKNGEKYHTSYYPNLNQLIKYN